MSFLVTFLLNWCDSYRWITLFKQQNTRNELQKHEQYRKMMRMTHTIWTNYCKTGKWWRWHIQSEQTTARSE